MSMRADVIGCGAAFQMCHAPSLRRLVRDKLLTIRSCIDVDADAAREAAELLRAESFGVPTECGPVEDVQAAIIATPPESHYALARPYAEAGKSVLLEKPFTAGLGEAQDLVGMSRARGAAILVGHFRRFYPSVQEARRFIRSGGLGKVHRVDAAEGARWEWPATTDYVVRSRWGGVVFDTGSHLCDMALFVLGVDSSAEADLAVEAVSKQPRNEPSHHCEARFTVASPAGDQITVNVRISRTQALPGAIKVYGERGLLLVPASYATAPQLLVGGDCFVLSPPTSAASASDSSWCFESEHRELVRSCGPDASPSDLDCSRFLLLQRLLDQLAAA